MKLSIIIPLYNEENYIESLLDKVLAVDLYKNISREIIIVDDFSTDKSVELIHNYLAQTNSHTIFQVISHPENRGKGAALQTGFQAASGDFIIIQDADLEYDPSEYNELLQLLIDDKADVVFGSRFTGAKARRSMGFWHYMANRFLTCLSNILFDIYLTDMETCYKAFRRKLLSQISLTERGFGIEPELTAKLSQIPGVRIFEVPISYYGRSYSEGKKINWKDGLKAIFYILKYRFQKLQ